MKLVEWLIKLVVLAAAAAAGLLIIVLMALLSALPYIIVGVAVLGVAYLIWGPMT